MCYVSGEKSKQVLKTTPDMVLVLNLLIVVVAPSLFLGEGLNFDSGHFQTIVGSASVLLLPNLPRCRFACRILEIGGLSHKHYRLRQKLAAWRSVW